METFEQQLLSDTADRIDDMVESFEEFEDWAEGGGYTAILHKIQESLRPMRSAANAARQYAKGELTRED